MKLMDGELLKLFKWACHKVYYILFTFNAQDLNKVYLWSAFECALAYFLHYNLAPQELHLNATFFFKISPGVRLSFPILPIKVSTLVCYK